MFALRLTTSRHWDGRGGARCDLVQTNLRTNASGAGNITTALVRRPDGVTEGADPRTLPRELLAEVHQPSPILDVIREKCLDCSGYQPSEIAKCTAVACSLWPYRMASNPFRAAREMTPEQREAGAARLAAARVRGRSASEQAAPVAEHTKYQGENEREDSAATLVPEAGRAVEATE
jgi:hypothetical protein